MELLRVKWAQDRQIDLHKSRSKGRMNRLRPDRARSRKGSVAAPANHPHKLV
jgi:hypothetical protein